MTIPSREQIEAVRRPSKKDRAAFAVSALAVLALVMSVASMVSIGMFIGIGAAPLFLLGAWLSPTRGRGALAVLGVCWGVFCAILLAVASTA